jgi:hypothetical protein
MLSNVDGAASPRDSAISKISNTKPNVSGSRDEFCLLSSRASSAKTFVVGKKTPRDGSDARSTKTGAVLDAQVEERSDSPASQRSAAMSLTSSKLASQKNSTRSGRSNRSHLQDIISEQLSSISEENSRLDAIEKLIATWSLSLNTPKKKGADDNVADKNSKTTSQDTKQQGGPRGWGNHQVMANVVSLTPILAKLKWPEPPIEKILGYTPNTIESSVQDILALFMHQKALCAFR